MKKLLLPIAACMMLGTAAFAQDVNRCGTPPLPLEFENWLQQKINERMGDPSAQNTVYNIPCIVHVINNGEAVGVGSNISQTQVNSQFTVLNNDYRKLNSDFSTVCPSVFQSVAADCQINFCKALRDPQGNVLPEPGIDRVNRNTKGFTAPPYSSTSYIDGTIKPNTVWPPANYLNIWVLNLGGGLLGYATFPANSTLTGLSGPYGNANTDGVVILYGAFGNTGTMSYPGVYDKGRTTVHEVGHWLGLRHIWGDSNCGNDFCTDTPVQQTANFGCPSFPQVTCTNGPNGDMWCNYMDYTDDRCMVMFTANQKTRMQTCMANGTYRLPLSSSFVCSPTGIADIDVQNRFNIYPNPTTGKITIDPLSMGSNLTVKIYNVVGEVVKEIKMESNTALEVDLSNQANGMYMIELSNASGKVTQKFSITH